MYGTEPINGLSKPTLPPLELVLDELLLEDELELLLEEELELLELEELEEELLDELPPPSGIQFGITKLLPEE